MTETTLTGLLRLESPPVAIAFTDNVLPEAINSDRTAVSFGCVGNRVYTGASENDAYFAIPGSQLAAVEEKLPAIVRANQELEKFHRGQTAAAAGG